MRARTAARASEIVVVRLRDSRARDMGTDKLIVAHGYIHTAGDDIAVRLRFKADCFELVFIVHADQERDDKRDNNRERNPEERKRFFRLRVLRCSVGIVAVGHIVHIVGLAVFRLIDAVVAEGNEAVKCVIICSGGELRLNGAHNIVLTRVGKYVYGASSCGYMPFAVAHAYEEHDAVVIISAAPKAAARPAAH